MPRTIRNYAIDYNKNKTIELKKIEDSFASAANYLKTIGWKKNQPCFFKINLKDNIPKKYLNSSARNIKNKRKIMFLKRYIKDFEELNIKDNLSAAIIIPDKDIIPGAETLSPAYIIFENYENRVLEVLGGSWSLWAPRPKKDEGNSWSCLGRLLGPCWAIFGQSWDHLKPILGYLRPCNFF